MEGLGRGHSGMKFLDCTMTIALNGQTHRVPESEEGPEGFLSVAALLGTLDLGPQPVLVELNGEALFPREFEERPVREGDRVEIVRMVAGG